MCNVCESRSGGIYRAYFGGLADGSAGEIGAQQSTRVWLLQSGGDSCGMQLLQIALHLFASYCNIHFARWRMKKWKEGRERIKTHDRAGEERNLIRMVGGAATVHPEFRNVWLHRGNFRPP